MLTLEPPIAPPILNASPSIPALTQPYTPEEIQNAYGLNNIEFGPAGETISGDGAGITIAIIDSGDDKYLVNKTYTKANNTLYPIAWGNSDLSMFDNQFGQQSAFNFTVVGEGGAPGSRPSWKTDPASTEQDAEDSMDVEWAHSIAPLANIVLIETLHDGTAGIANAVAGAVRTVGAQVVSMSLSFDDQVAPDLPVSTFDIPGVTFVAASGDTGTPAEGPADYPDVVAVAATDLTLNNDQYPYNFGTTAHPEITTISSASYNSEVGWSNPPSGVAKIGNFAFDNDGGSGGGISLFPVPSYQQGLVISDGNQTLTGVTGRTTPDVSFIGGTDSSTTAPVQIVVRGKITSSGGTSLSAPCFAGLVAIADQGIEFGGVDPLNDTEFGNDSPLSSYQTLDALYSLPSYDFHDITAGFNGYAAGPGYDLVSGLGSPIANQLVPDLAKAAPSFATGTQGTNPILAPLSYEGRRSTPRPARRPRRPIT